MTLVVLGYQTPRAEDSTTARSSSILSTTTVGGVDMAANPAVDQLIAANVATIIAERASLPVATNVANLSQSLSAESELAQTDVSVITKPQIIQPTSNTRDVQQYMTKTGDTVQSVAAAYGVSPDTIKFNNNLVSDALEPNRQLKILPIDGVLYTVRAGDSIDSIVAKYKTNRAQVVAYNDLEIEALSTGRQIIVPGANVPEQERPGYVAPRTTTTTKTTSSGAYRVSSSLASASVGNRYAYGNCTYYAYERRMQLGMPVGSFWGNAATWAAYAQAAGYRVDGSPEVGAVMQTSGGWGGYGHVSIVEKVNPGVSITISEMNGYRFGGGFNRIGIGDIGWGEATSGLYRYIH